MKAPNSFRWMSKDWLPGVCPGVETQRDAAVAKQVQYHRRAIGVFFGVPRSWAARGPSIDSRCRSFPSGELIQVVTRLAASERFESGKKPNVGLYGRH